jgi:carbon monoxide dehydrogenase subunit G
VPRTFLSLRIEAPPARVFRSVAHIEEFSKAVPGIVRVEFLTGQHTGKGTRFRETRLLRGKESSVDLEVTEYEPDARVRLVSDTHGTVWDTVFTVTPEGSASVLAMTMDATGRGLVPKIMNVLIKGMVQKAIASDLASVKAYCER